MELTNEQLVAEIQAGNNVRANEKELIERNIKLVQKIAHALNIPGVDVKDRIQDGAIGMLEAVKTYNPEKGMLFSSHAFKRIRAKIMREGTEQANMIHLPAHIIELRMNINTITREFITMYGKRPTVDELVELTGKSYDDVKAAIDTTTMPSSLDQTIEGGEGDEMSIADIVGGDMLEEEEWQDARTKAIVSYLDELPKLEQRIVIERLGLRDGVAKTIRELEGVILNDDGGKISYVTINSRYEKAIDYIRRRIAGEQIVFTRTQKKATAKKKDESKRDIVLVISQDAKQAFMSAELAYSEETHNSLVRLLNKHDTASKVLANDDAVILQYRQGITMDNLRDELVSAMEQIKNLKLTLVQ